MPPKAGGESNPWTDESKLEFVTKFFYTQVQGKLDWKIAPIPEGRTKYGCEHLMRNLRSKYVTDGGKKTSGADDSASKKPKATKTTTKSNKKRKVAKDEVEEDEDMESEQDDGNSMKEEDEAV